MATRDTPTLLAGRGLGGGLALATLVLLSGCQRGCLSDWFRDRGSASKAATPLTMMSGVDCPDGLARCVAGAVEVSHVARVPRPCPPSSRPEDCQCPWEAVETCPRGCTEEGTEVVVPPERAAARLCAPDPINPPARPVVGVLAPPGACGAEGYRCLGSLVIACSPGVDRSAADGGLTPRVFAACARGCFEEGEALGAEEADPEGAARILCAR
ncbi:MAG: hypothetical protein ACLQBL_31850 [Polyangiaceae bacterium]|jgi:hypothetical protein